MKTCTMCDNDRWVPAHQGAPLQRCPACEYEVHLLGLLATCLAHLEYWTPDETMATEGEQDMLNAYYNLRDQLNVVLKD